MPSEPTCDKCGETFGNEGARTAHEKFCDGGGDGDGGGDDGSSDDRIQTGQEPSPSKPVKRQSRNADGGGLTQADEQGARAAGEGLSEVAAGIRSDDPETKKQATETGMELLKGLASGLIDKRAERERRAEERAKNADVREASEFPMCPGDGCSARFRSIPPGAEVIECPECGGVFEVE